MTDGRERHQDPTNLVWVDLEMTGLDPSRDCILQAALVITTRDLEPLETYCVDVWQPEERLSLMVPFVQTMHQTSGLLDRVRSAVVDERRLQQELLERISAWCPYHAVLCGNTIHSDRKFIARYLPAVDAYLHYRMIDVSSLKVLAELWYPEARYEKPRAGQHDALFDIQQSIAELRHYRRTMMAVPESEPVVPV